MSLLVDKIEAEQPNIDLESRYTLAEFLGLPFADGYDYELLIGGRILATSKDPGPGAPHGDAAGNIFAGLKAYVMLEKARGWVWADTSVQLQSTGRYVKPDVTYLPASNITTNYTGPITDLPGLVVEVNSPSDQLRDIEDKLATYLEAQIPLIWSVYPARSLVEVYRPGALKPEVYGLGDKLEDAALLPGFSLSCEAIFARYKIEKNADSSL